MIVLSNTILQNDKYLQYAIPYFADRGSILGVSSDQLLIVADFPNQWDPAIKDYCNPKSHGDATTAQMNFVNKKVMTYINSVCHGIKINPSNKEILTPLDYLTLHIHQDEKRRTGIPAPDYRIGIVCKSFSYLNHVIQVFDIANLTHVGKPKDVTGLKVRMLVQKPETPPPTLKDLVQMQDETTMIFDIPYTIDQLNNIAYIAVCFTNGTGDGDYSEIIACRII